MSRPTALGRPHVVVMAVVVHVPVMSGWLAGHVRVLLGVGRDGGWLRVVDA